MKRDKRGFLPKTSNYTDDQIEFIIGERSNGKKWEEIAESFTKKYIKKSADSVRKIYAKYKHLNLVPDSYINNLKQTHSAKKHSSLLSKDNKMLTDYLCKADILKDLFDSVLLKTKFNLHKPVITKKKPKKVKRVLLAHLSDLHYGTKVSKSEMSGLNEFTPTIAARRTAYFFKQLVEYASAHKEETKLALVINGDLFAGVIHDTDTNELIVNQFVIALDVLGEGISYLANNFNQIEIHVTTGNHDRLVGHKDSGRVYSAKYDSFSTIAYKALQREFLKYKNVELNIVSTPFCDFSVLHYRIYATHGDTVFKIGTPSQSINTGAISSQINAINNGGLVVDKQKFDIFLFAHMHTPVATIAQGGEYVFINGSLIGMDSFSQGIGINVNNPAQQFIELTSEHIGNMRFSNLLPADKDKSLDLIIKEPHLIS